MHNSTIMIGCEVVVKELNTRIPKDMPLHLIDPALHVNPDRLRKTLQEAINQEERQYDTLLFGFGLCSRAIEGLLSKHAKMVFPLVDDCIGLFLGSKAAHLEQIKKEPGTFFLSKGWINAGTTPFEEYDYMVKRFGIERAGRLMRAMLQNYTRLAFIDTGCCGGDIEAYSKHAKNKATRFGLRYEEIIGTASIFDKLINAGASNGAHKELLIIPPGEEVTYEMLVRQDRQYSIPLKTRSVS